MSHFLSPQVSEELIRVAILWHEMWHEGLEEASRLYFGERNVKGMFAVLEPLHAMMERGPQTLKETSFNQVRLLFSFIFFKVMFIVFILSCIFPSFYHLIYQVTMIDKCACVSKMCKNPM